MVYKVPNVSFGNKTPSRVILCPGLIAAHCLLSSSPAPVLQFIGHPLLFTNPENFYLNRLVRLRNPL